MSKWLEFKLSWEVYKKGPESLVADEKQNLENMARRQAKIEQRVLESADAVGVVVPFVTLDGRLKEIRDRYRSGDEYQADLARLAMSEADLSCAVNRDLLVEAVLEKVAAGVAPASEVDAEIYFRLHPAAFSRGEARRLRHILITFDSPQQKAEARALLEGVRSRVKTADEFAKAALTHSQCPTAMQQGEMGLVQAGKLFPELEDAAFSLPVGQVSEVQESPMGLHVLWCDEIFPARTLEFGNVRDALIGKLNEKRRAKAQRQWLESLLKQEKAAA